MLKCKLNITGHCLVTGSSSGIGKAVVLEFASKGVPIVAISNDKRALVKLKNEITSVFDVDCYILNKDLLDEKSPLEIYQWCMDNKIDVQILINNIGLVCSGRFEDSCEKSNEDLVRLNLFPMLQLTRYFLPTLKSYNNSYILNMSSLGRCIPMSYKALYAASKAFVYSFSKALSVELKSANVQVSVSCPAGVYTNPHVVQRINSGGIIAKWTSLSVDRVSYFIVNFMLKGKKTIVPGIGAKFLLFLMRVLPESLNILIAGRMIKKMKGKINHIVSESFEEFVSWRKHIHANPELSFEEVKTVNFVAGKLDEMGVNYTKGIAGTGLVALIEGENPSRKCIALRADLDALPIQEENEISFKSTFPGVMHACGHDVHTTCLLGAAKVLNALKSNFEGSVKLIFQPGEEVLPGGASMMISEGVLENPSVDEIYALHVFPDMDAGKIGFKAGKYMAACDELYLSVVGKAGHAALPDQYNNPIMIIAELLPKLHSYLNSISIQDEPFVFAFGDLHAAGATNVIPKQANAKGTLRTMNEKWRAEIHIKLKTFVQDFLKSKNAKGELKIIKGYPFLNNNIQLTSAAFSASQAILGEKNVEEMAIRMTAEDFSFYSQLIPACFFRLGVRNASLGIIHGVHHPKFNIDHQALKVGVASLSYIAVNSLKTN